MPEAPCRLDPEILGTLKRPGYAIERLTFQSRPGVRVTANLYRPDPAENPCPAVLSVHGHWAWARMDPHVQPRCIALAKLGYVVLSVDAFGAGERAIEPAPGTYHGGLIGASLLPVGTPLIGLQVYDNRRAVDYLISRKEVDASQLAVTGASGGGNQTLYAGATDDRFKAVIPVCGIGTYRRLSEHGLLCLRDQPGRSRLRHHWRPPGNGRAASTAGHQRHTRRTAIQRGRGRQERGAGSRAISVAGCGSKNPPSCRGFRPRLQRADAPGDVRLG